MLQQSHFHYAPQSQMPRYYKLSGFWKKCVGLYDLYSCKRLPFCVSLGNNPRIKGRLTNFHLLYSGLRGMQSSSACWCHSCHWWCYWGTWIAWTKQLPRNLFQWGAVKGVSSSQNLMKLRHLIKILLQLISQTLVYIHIPVLASLHDRWFIWTFIKPSTS